MSLDFKLGDIKNYRELCWTDSQLGHDCKQLTGLTHALIWDTMTVGLGEVTEKNLDEWMYRLCIMDRVYPREMKITRQDLVSHIGLRTNASTFTRAAFKKKAMNMLDGEARRHVERSKKETVEVS